MIPSKSYFPKGVKFPELHAQLTRQMNQITPKPNLFKLTDIPHGRLELQILGLDTFKPLLYSADENNPKVGKQLSQHIM